MVMRQLDYLDQPGMASCNIDLDDRQRVLDVNITGTLLALQACARPMIERQIAGRCITIASIAAKHPVAGPVTYTALKVAVWMLTKKAPRELAPANIRVNAIGPGFISTNMTAVLDDAKTELMKQVPLGRLWRAS